MRVTLVDRIQIASLALVTTALVVSVVQIRLLARQTSEAARQATAATAALKHAAYQSVLAGQADYRSYKSDPDMLRWFLASRGYEVGSDAANQRTMFALARLNTHESTFLGHAGGLLDDDIWSGWRNVIAADLAMPEFRAVWPQAKVFYAPSFAAFIDGEIAKPEPPDTGADDEPAPGT